MRSTELCERMERNSCDGKAKKLAGAEIRGNSGHPRLGDVLVQHGYFAWHLRKSGYGPVSML